MVLKFGKRQNIMVACGRGYSAWGRQEDMGQTGMERERETGISLGHDAGS